MGDQTENEKALKKHSRWSNVIGTAVGVAASVFTPGNIPILPIPDKAPFPFDKLGIAAALAGLIIGTLLTRVHQFSSPLKLILATILNLLFVVAAVVAFKNQYSINTPTNEDYIIELLLFMVAHFSLFVLLAIAWHVVSRQLLSTVPWFNDH